MISAWPKAASSSSFGQGDVVILKVITPPEDFQKLLSQVRVEDKKAGITKADLKSSIAKVRRPAK